ncbi:MAG: UrcA family protein [Povalibacter sp.]
MYFANLKSSATDATRARRALLTAIGVTALSFASATVMAETPLPSTVVSLQGLDLSQPSDAKQAYAKLNKAAKQVCQQFDIAEPRGMKVRNQCFKTALANAVNAVNNESLTQLHQSDRNVRLAQRMGNRVNNI